MKLQIRKKESWHTMLDFEAAQRFEVEDAAASLSRAAGGLPLRMLDDDGTVRHLNSDGAFRNPTIESLIRNEDYEALEKMNRGERELKDAESIAQGAN